MADRELAERTTLAFEKLQQWYAEVSLWEWPAVGRSGVSTGFEVPTMEERTSKRRKLSEDMNRGNGDMQNRGRKLGLSGTVMQEPSKSRGAEQQTDNDEDYYWGGCPARLVKQYQDRIDAITAGIAGLDLEDLQDRVLGRYSVRNPL